MAALAAYFRALPSPWQDQLREPANVKKLIMIFQRTIAVPDQENSGQLLTIWNGQVGPKSCLRDYDTRKEWDTDGRCPTISENLDQITEDPCRDDAGGVTWWGRLCAILGPDSGDGNGDSDGFSKAVDWTPGEDSPKCPSGTCGGKLCKGYYCTPEPKGNPPDFYDPKNPDAPNPGTLDPNNPSPEPGWDNDDDDDDEEPAEPSSVKYKFMWSANVSTRRTCQPTYLE